MAGNMPHGNACDGEPIAFSETERKGKARHGDRLRRLLLADTAADGDGDGVQYCMVAGLPFGGECPVVSEVEYK